MGNSGGESFVARHLDAGSRMGEILFGLIMTLTFTLGAGMVIEEQGREGARQMLLAVLGCNLAWGVIDGIFYVLGQLYERGRLLKAGILVREAASEDESRRHVAAELDDLLVPVTDEATRRALYSTIVRQLRAAPSRRNRLRREDVLGGLVAGLLVFACSFPALLPFFFVHDLRFAVRLSNALLLVLLFVVGCRYARDTLARPVLTGFVFLGVGLVLVLVTIALGG